MSTSTCFFAGKAILSQEVADLLGDACVTEQLPCKAVLLKEVLNRPACRDEVRTAPFVQGTKGPPLVHGVGE